MNSASRLFGRGHEKETRLGLRSLSKEHGSWEAAESLTKGVFVGQRMRSSGERPGRGSQEQPYRDGKEARARLQAFAPAVPFYNGLGVGRRKKDRREKDDRGKEVEGG